MLFLGMIAVAAAETPAATRTTLTVTTDNTGPRTRATLSAHVEADPSTIPLGVVNFRSGNSDLGSAVVDRDGNASLMTASLPPGQHEIVAVYEGQTQYQTSTSKAQPLEAHASSVAGYTVGASSTSLKTTVGGFASSVITITPNNGFSGYVALSCTGLPAYSSCTFNPTSVSANCTTSQAGVQTCTPGTSTMEIQTLAPSPDNGKLEQNRTTTPVFAFAFPMLAGLAGFGAWKRRGWRNLLLAFVAFAGVLGMGGCAQRYNYLNHGPPGNTGTPAGTYTITVIASSSIGATTITPPSFPQITFVLAKS
jgi:Bacterial Ig-like domain (group 3)